MVNYGELQFAERIMVARRSEMSAEWKVRFAICIASVAMWNVDISNVFIA
jgi:hypothetical protein